MAKDFEKMAGKSIIKKVSNLQTFDGQTITEIPVEEIKPSPYNNEIWEVTDDAVALISDGIKRRGFENHPVGVYDMGDFYEIYDGHVRFEAAKKAGMTMIPCIVKPEPDEKRKWDDLISSNMDSRSMTYLERAKAYQAYKDHVMPGATVKELGEHFHTSTASISRLLSLLKLDPALGSLAGQVSYMPLSKMTDLTPLQQKLIAEKIKVHLDEGDQVSEYELNLWANDARGVTRKKEKEKERFQHILDSLPEFENEPSAAPLYEPPTEVELMCRDCLAKIKKFKMKEKTLKDTEIVYVQQVKDELSEMLERQESLV